MGRPETANKLVLLGSLYLAQGLPDGFFRQALPVMLRQQGVSLENIGLAPLLALPWAFKFLLAPLVDWHGSPRFGRRRSWIVPLQIASVATLLLLSLASPTGDLRPLLAGVLVMTVLAATQDIAADGLAVTLLAPEERGLGNGVQVAAYRLGMIVSGGVLLIVFDRVGWSGAFYVMAAITGLALLPVLRTAEPPAPPPERASWRVYAGFLRQPGAGLWLLTIASFKFGEAFGMGMLRPLLVDRGLSLSDLGWITGTAGFIAGLVGAMVGGVMVGTFGRHRMLIIFGAVQALAVASCITLVGVGPLDPLHAYLVCTFEHLASGMATVALFTMMMDACRPHAAGTDYTLQACVVVFVTIVASAFSGYSAARHGFADHFAIAAGLCLLGLAPALLHRAHLSRGTGQPSRS